MPPAHGICERWKFINVIKRKLNSDFPSSNLRPLKLKSDCERFATLHHTPYWLLYIIIIAECHQPHHVATHEACEWLLSSTYLSLCMFAPTFFFLLHNYFYMYFIKVRVFEKPWICLLKKVLHEWHLSLDWIFFVSHKRYTFIHICERARATRQKLCRLIFN